MFTFIHSMLIHHPDEVCGVDQPVTVDVFHDRVIYHTPTGRNRAGFPVFIHASVGHCPFSMPSGDRRDYHPPKCPKRGAVKAP